MATKLCQMRLEKKVRCLSRDLHGRKRARALFLETEKQVCRRAALLVPRFKGKLDMFQDGVGSM
jgi:hypothetical protein